MASKIGGGEQLIFDDVDPMPKFEAFSLTATGAMNKPSNVGAIVPQDGINQRGVGSRGA